MKTNFSFPLSLPFILIALLGSIYLLPQRGKSAASAVEFNDHQMHLPEFAGSWEGVPQVESADERRILSPDTRFKKAIFHRRADSILPSYDRVTASIVLSGSDLNNSIHRPERCLPAQGHYNLTSTSFRIKLENGVEIPIRRLKTRVKLHSDKDSKDDAPSVDCLTYYFFVGHDHITHSHYQRTYKDMMDRLFRGRDQRWAYIQFSIQYGNPELGLHLDESRADELMKNLIQKSIPHAVNWSAVKSIDPAK